MRSYQEHNSRGEDGLDEVTDIAHMFLSGCGRRNGLSP